MNVWKIHLKINCLHLMWWQFNHFKMWNSASWAHHSRSVEFGEHNSRPQHTMCTSSIVNASSKALLFFMSGHVCHLIVFSLHMPPFSIFMLINCVLFGTTCEFATVGLSWLNDWEGVVILFIPGRLSLRVSFWCHYFSPSVVSKCGLYHVFPIKMVFHFEIN